MSNLSLFFGTFWNFFRYFHLQLFETKPWLWNLMDTEGWLYCLEDSEKDVESLNMINWKGIKAIFF